jgi:hypothetical protein
MKYWNKQHKVREKWHKVELPNTRFYSRSFPEFNGWVAKHEFKDLKRELQLIDSPGKFYMSIMHKEVYFEHQQDAVYFSLRYL